MCDMQWVSESPFINGHTQLELIPNEYTRIGISSPVPPFETRNVGQRVNYDYRIRPTLEYRWSYLTYT